MKKVLKTITIVAVLFMAISCHKHHEEVVEKRKLAATAETAKIEFNIIGLTCDDDEGRSVAKQIIKMDGVAYVSVNCDEAKAIVKYDVDLVNPEQISERISSGGGHLKMENLQTITE